MSVEVTYQRKCDRCGADIGDPTHSEVRDEDAEPILSLEAKDLGVTLKTMRDVCETCRAALPALLKQVVSTKKPAKKDKGES